MVVVVVVVMIVIITDVDYGKLSFAGQPLADKFTGKAPVPLYVCLSFPLMKSLKPKRSGCFLLVL